MYVSSYYKKGEDCVFDVGLVILCRSVLNLNAFERQIKAESLGVGAEDNSGTSLTSKTKCFFEKRMYLSEEAEFSFY